MPTDAPMCTVDCKDFYHFESEMRKLIGWPVPFSWSKSGQVWIAVQGLKKPNRAILNGMFPALDQIINFLSMQVDVGALDKTAGFFVGGDGIWRKRPFVRIARLQCIER